MDNRGKAPPERDRARYRGPVLHTDAAGVELTVPSPDAGAAWDHLVDGLLFFAPDFPARLDAAAAHETAVAHALRAWLLHQGHDPRFDAATDRSLTTARRLAPGTTARERSFVDAVTRSVTGTAADASRAWLAHAAAHPHDLLGVRLAYFDHYERGDTANTRAVIDGARRAWDADHHWYPVLLGLAAFAHGESGDEATAERLGREGAERAPHDLWCVHSVAHAYEETHRPADGTRWLAAHRPYLDPVVGFARHLWWHDALFLLALDELDAVLARYDEHVAHPSSEQHLDLTNRASLLARLEYRGVDVGDRWDALRELTARRVTDRRSLFVHAHLAFVEGWSTTGDPGAYLRETEQWAATDDLVRDLGLPLAHAVLARAGRLDPTAFPPLDPALTLLDRLGGSRAQRAVFCALAGP